SWSCPINRNGITSTRWALITFLNTWAISLATWVVLLCPTKQSITTKSKPNRNIFVGVCQRRTARDGKLSRPSWEANSMQQIITAKLKLTTTPEQFEALRETQLAYRDALNAVRRYAF